VLALLGLWAVVYMLTFIAFPGMQTALPFEGIAPDVVFLLAALLLIGRGLSGERGWALIGAGAACWAAGDIYWTLALANVASPPVPSGPTRAIWRSVRWRSSGSCRWSGNG